MSGTSVSTTSTRWITRDAINQLPIYNRHFPGDCSRFNKVTNRMIQPHQEWVDARMLEQVPGTVNDE
jgi:hypothetical protein